MVIEKYKDKKAVENGDDNNSNPTDRKMMTHLFLIWDVQLGIGICDFELHTISFVNGYVRRER